MWKAHLLRVFEAIDTDGSGSIDRAELAAAIKDRNVLEAMPVLKTMKKVPPVPIAKLQADFHTILARIFDSALSTAELFDRIDTDKSGRISFDEFWSFIRAQFSKQAEPELKQLCKERAVHAFYTYKEYVASLWKGRATASTKEVNEGIFAHEDLRRAGVKIPTGPDLSFDTAWASIEDQMSKIVHDEVYGSTKAAVASMRDVWKAHYLRVFEAIDTDGSGSIDKAEFANAIGAVEKLASIEVGDKVDIEELMQQQFKHILSKIFDSELSDADLFDRLDTDASGLISWDEFWTGVQSEVNRITGPALQRMWAERTLLKLKAHRFTLKQAWKGLKKAHVDAVRAAMRGSPFLSAFIEQLPPAEADSLIEFKAAWKALSGPINDKLQAETHDALRKEVRAMREVWKAHLLRVFEAIDTDGSGSIDRAEFASAMANVAGLGEMRVGEGIPYQEQLQRVIAGVFDVSLSSDELFRRIDTDASGLISWQEFWTFVEAEVTKVAGPELNATFQSNCGAALYSHKQTIRQLWDDNVELPGNVIGPKIGAVAALTEVYETTLKTLPIFLSASAVTFDETWSALESKMVEIVRKTEFESMDKQIRTQRQVWKSHFLRIFESIDTDGSGSIDSDELHYALANLERLRTVKVHEQRVAEAQDVGVQARFREILARIFDSALTTEALFNRIDTDDSGQISWDEFWSFVEREVTQETSALLHRLWKERTIELQSANKARLRKLWGGAETRAIKLSLVEKELNRHLQRRPHDGKEHSDVKLPSPERALPFEAAWEVVEEATLGLIRDAVHATLKSEVYAMRDVWKSHFHMVFNEIDADGSGQIDKAEFVAALANLQQLGDLQVDNESSPSVLQEQFNAILARIFDTSVSMHDLFDRIDTDHSGHISWDEFWAYVEAEVTAIAGPDLRAHHKERTVHQLYAHKAYIHGLWLGMSKISVAKIVAGFRQDPKLDDIYDECLSSLDIFGAGGAMDNELTFDDAWAHIESAIVRIVQAEQYEEIQSSVRSVRDMWKGHFLSVFSAIDTDGNGTIEKQEFQLALTNVARLSQMRVGHTGQATSAAEMQQQFREILSAIFDSKLNASALFERIDLDHSGQISWSEFWEFVEKEVTKVAGPELKKLFVDRCGAELYSRKTELAALFGQDTELSEANIIDRAKEASPPMRTRTHVGCNVGCIYPIHPSIHSSIYPSIHPSIIITIIV